MKKLGVSELIQSGILMTLLGIAFSLGQVMQKFELKIEDHENRIVKIENKIDFLHN